MKRYDNIRNNDAKAILCSCDIALCRITETMEEFETELDCIKNERIIHRAQLLNSKI